MTMEKHDVELPGCSPVPLAHYLKALGLFRLVAEQVDAEARCYWQEDAFHLVSNLNKEAILTFLLNDYDPTPVVAPWNGGSGFYYREEKIKKKDPVTGKRIKTGQRNQPTAATKVVDSILSSSAERLSLYRKSLKIAKDVVNEMGLQKAPIGEVKEVLIQAIRNNLQDSAIAWLDASVILTTENAKYPPLLGTGGNDGNTDFSSNFMQRICEIFDPDDGSSGGTSRSWLKNSLFATISDGLVKGVAIGQFFPCAVGGANAESGFGSDSHVNPWDFVLMIEGSLLFAAATVKRLQANEPGVLSYPFSVNSSGVGYGSASPDDEKTSRAEMWVPLWDRQTGLVELKAIMGEGRSQIGKRPARNGVDFARAVAGLGVDRGLTSFQRYGFLERNGRAYFAVPLDRFMVSRQPQADLLNEVDGWMALFGDKAKSERAPASVGRAFRRLEATAFSLCKEKGPARVQDVLIALGGCEKAIVRSFRWAKNSFVRPVPVLSERWLREADDGSPEFRLAASLASVYGHYTDREGKKIAMPIRSQMEPVHTWFKDGHLGGVAFDEVVSGDVIWSEGNPIEAMNGMMARRIMRAVQSGSKSYPDIGRINADLGDVADFIEDRVDIYRMGDLLWGLILVNWPSVSRSVITRLSLSDAVQPGASYGLLKLCFAGGAIRGSEVPMVPEIHRRAALGDSLAAMQLAERRLRGSGLTPVPAATKLSGNLTERTAAALLFPIGKYQVAALAKRVLRLEAGKVENSWMGEEENARSF